MQKIYPTYIQFASYSQIFIDFNRIEEIEEGIGFNYFWYEFTRIVTLLLLFFDCCLSYIFTFFPLDFSHKKKK